MTNKINATLTHLSLFSGIGSLDLAAEAAGFETVCQCEWADFPHSVLSARWPDVPRFRDITTFTKEAFFEKTGLASLLAIGKTSFRSSIIQDAGSCAQCLSEKIIPAHAAAVVPVPLERPAAHPHFA